MSSPPPSITGPLLLIGCDQAFVGRCQAAYRGEVVAWEPPARPEAWSTEVKERCPAAIIFGTQLDSTWVVHACTSIRGLSFAAELPMLVLVGDELPEEAEQIFGAGATDFLRSSASSLELRARLGTLQKFFEQTRAIDAERQLREDFTSSLIHDLRGIVSHMSFLIHFLRSGQAEDRSKWLNELAQAVKRLHGMLDDLLISAKSQSQGLELCRKPVSVRHLLDRNLRYHRAVADARGIALSLHVAPEADIEINVDESLVSRLFDNLLSNALKFSAKGGAISLEAKLEKQALLLNCRDEGVGVPEPLRDKIFERYFSGKGHGNSKKIGMGLYFCRLVAEAHQGRIYVADNDPCGACFHVELPLTEASMSS